MLIHIYFVVPPIVANKATRKGAYAPLIFYVIYSSKSFSPGSASGSTFGFVSKYLCKRSLIRRPLFFTVDKIVSRSLSNRKHIIFWLRSPFFAYSLRLRSFSCSFFLFIDFILVLWPGATPAVGVKFVVSYCSTHYVRGCCWRVRTSVLSVCWRVLTDC